MDRLKNRINSTNINTIVTIISIIITGLGVYVALMGYMNLVNILVIIILLLSISIIILSRLNKKLIDQNKRKDQQIENERQEKKSEIEAIEKNVVYWKDQSAKWQDKLSICSQDLTEWKKDCEFLLDNRNDMNQEIQRLQEKLQSIYEKDPDLNPTHQTSLPVDIILRPSTEFDNHLGRIHRKIRGP